MGDLISDLVREALEATSQISPQVLAALFGIAFLTEIGIPFPLILDSVLFLAGYQVSHLGLQPTAVILVLLLGRECGSGALFWLSRAVGDRVIGWLEHRFPKLRERIESLSKKNGMPQFLSVILSQLVARNPSLGPLSSLGIRASSTVALARITPGLLSLTTIACGMIGLPYRYFAFGVGCTSVLVDSAEIILGVIIGFGIIHVEPSHSPWLIVIGVTINLFLLWVVPRLIWRPKSKLNHPVDTGLRRK